jgi:hypothetical protein
VGQDRVVIDGRTAVIRRTHGLGTIERVVRERNRYATPVIDRDNLKCRPAAVDHCKTGAFAHTFDDLGEGGPQAFRIDWNIHDAGLNG